MDREKTVLQLIKEHNEYYDLSVGGNYPDQQGKATLWNHFEEMLQQMLKEDDPTLADDQLQNLAEWYLNYAQYAWARSGDKDLQNRAFAYGSWCAYQAIQVCAEVGRIEETVVPIFESGELMFWWSNLLLCGWEEETEQIMQLALDSNNDSDDKGIMGEGGYSLDTASFFLMELYCLWREESFNRNDFDHPLNDGLDTPFI
ncbi:MAG: hypothetical protein AAFO09_08630, partial [Pseudomonadota bacterium]